MAAKHQRLQSAVTGQAYNGQRESILLQFMLTKKSIIHIGWWFSMPISGLIEMRIGGFFAVPIGGLFHANMQFQRRYFYLAL